MGKILLLGHGGSINMNRVIAIAPARSAPVIRMVKATHPSRVLNLTYGYPRRSIIILDNGFVVFSSRTPDEIARAIGLSGEADDEDQPPWW